MKVAASACGLLLVASAASAQSGKSVSSKYETCREAVGQTQRDLNNALAFCKQSVPKDLEIQGVMAMESLLWIKISRPLANAMTSDKLSTERVVKNWMGRPEETQRLEGGHGLILLPDVGHPHTAEIHRQVSARLLRRLLSLECTCSRRG